MKKLRGTELVYSLFFESIGLDTEIDMDEKGKQIKGVKIKSIDESELSIVTNKAYKYSVPNKFSLNDRDKYLRLNKESMVVPGEYDHYMYLHGNVGMIDKILTGLKEDDNHAFTDFGHLKQKLEEGVREYLGVLIEKEKVIKESLELNDKVTEEANKNTLNNIVKNLRSKGYYVRETREGLIVDFVHELILTRGFSMGLELEESGIKLNVNKFKGQLITNKNLGKPELEGKREEIIKDLNEVGVEVEN